MAESQYTKWLTVYNNASLHKMVDGPHWLLITFSFRDNYLAVRVRVVVKYFSSQVTFNHCYAPLQGGTEQREKKPRYIYIARYPKPCKHADKIVYNACQGAYAALKEASFTQLGRNYFRSTRFNTAVYWNNKSTRILSDGCPKRERLPKEVKWNMCWCVRVR